MKHTHIEIREVGEQVVCDACGDDYSDSDESGGFLFGSYAYCPKCARERIESIRRYGEEKFIISHCPEGMSYREWVLALREGDNTVKIISTSEE